jgi:hypothetical protein
LRINNVSLSVYHWWACKQPIGELHCEYYFLLKRTGELCAISLRKETENQQVDKHPEYRGNTAPNSKSCHHKINTKKHLLHNSRERPEEQALQHTREHIHFQLSCSIPERCLSYNLFLGFDSMHLSALLNSVNLPLTHFPLRRASARASTLAFPCGSILSRLRQAYSLRRGGWPLPKA